MSRPNEAERKARVNVWREEQRTAALVAMPLSLAQLNALLRYLRKQTAACDHTTRSTTAFLESKGLDSSRILPWLADQHGLCDCEIRYNLPDLAESLKKPKPTKRPPTKTKQDRVARSLVTPTGWNLQSLPTPWRIANLYMPKEPLRLQLGSKGGCTVTFLDLSPPAGDPATDDYWIRLWWNRTQLPPRSAFRVDRETLQLPAGLRSVVVNDPRWSPIYGWIFPADAAWRLEVHTECRRRDGDLSQVAQLITRLASNG